MNSRFSSKLYKVKFTGNVYTMRLNPERVLKLPYLSHIISIITWAANVYMVRKRQRSSPNLNILKLVTTELSRSQEGA